MEVEPPPSAVAKPTLTRKASTTTTASASASFRLRSPSLNSVRLRRIFDLFDKNNDGVITVEELSQALSLLGLDAEYSELESTVRAHIRPGNNGLVFEDFVSLHQSLDDAFFSYGDEDDEKSEANHGSIDATAQEESDLTEAFKVFDEDGDGYISAYELQVVLRKLNLPEAKELDRVQQMICSVDRNHDGRVDFFEFKDMMRSVLVHSS